MSSRFTIDREVLIRVFFFSTFAFLLYQLFILSRPFIPSFLLAVMLAIAFFPVYRHTQKYIKNPNMAALIVTMIVFLSALLPLVWLGWVFLKESGRIIPVAQNLMETLNGGQLNSMGDRLPPGLLKLAHRGSEYLAAFNIDPKPWVIENLRDLGSRITSIGGMLAANAIFTFFRGVILLVALFFMFRDGKAFFDWFLGLVPMEPVHKMAVARSAYETFKAVSIGVFVTAMAQGVTAMIGFFIAGVRLPVILGIATFVTSLLGASFVAWLPVALFVMMDRSGAGLFLLIWGLVVVGWLDNILKPILIGSRARMPFVLVFFSILGGLKMYGLLGLLLGPILVAAVLAFARIYREAYTQG